MHIRFDTNLKIAGIGLVPWTRLGPEQWLPNYAIASLYDWDMPTSASLPPVYSLQTENFDPNGLVKLNTPTLLATEEFRTLLHEKLPDYALLTYKPIDVPSELANRTFLSASKSFTDKFENKADFRQAFKDVANFPDFTVYDRRALELDQATFTKLMAGRPAVVLQDEVLSGGKGTYIVTNFSEFSRALLSLQGLSQHTRLVVSTAISNARERSIQCCVTKYGIFTGPLQHQIVRHPALAANGVGDQFCGGVIIEDEQGTVEHQAMQAAARSIAEVMQASGYKGIFGVDFLLADNQLFVLEVNARLTGLTPLLTALYPGNENIPFYLLHLLELGNYNYAVTDDSITFPGSGSLLLLHSLSDEQQRITFLPPSGTYECSDGQLKQVSRNITLHELQANQFVLQQYRPPDLIVQPGGRLITLLFREAVLDKNTEVLYNHAMQVIETVRNNIKFESVR